ncbi:MAG TPA: tetratricopeptide repeat protein [Vicinamibacterales bacterium]|nr:tetratricopeptide repeat protein [Vicinamibacterales bacterium]
MKFIGPLDRRFTIGIAIAATVPAFALTHLIVTRYRDQRQDLAVEWSRRGDRELERRPALAVTDFQTALSYGPERADDRLRLANALIAAKRPTEAKAQLLTLWGEEPGNGEVNLALARLSAGHGDVTDAVRYYHAAVDGAWETGAATARRRARLDLARLLMSHGQPIRAQAELIALIDDLPANARLITNVGQLLIDAGAPERAIGLFRRVLELDPTDAEAARLAGEVEYRAGDFEAANRDLQRASTRAALNGDARDMLDVSDRVLTLDPYAARLAARARAQRVLRALVIARARLVRCQGTPAHDAATDARIGTLQVRLDATGTLTPRALERDADLVDDALAVVFDVERLPPAACGGDSADDRALAIIAGPHPALTQ